MLAIRTSSSIPRKKPADSLVVLTPSVASGLPSGSLDDRLDIARASRSAIAEDRWLLPADANRSAPRASSPALVKAKTKTRHSAAT